MMSRHVALNAVLKMALLIVAGFCSAQAATSSLVYEDGNGNLVYGTYANQGQTNSVNTVPDFSNCGYKGGGVEIPFVPTVVTVNAPTGGDDTSLIQGAIDQVAAMGVQANGFRGAVLIKAGNYKVASTINIRKGGIVVRGEGSQATGGTTITMTATVQDDLFDIRGSGIPSEVNGTRVTITDAYVPSGARSFNVSNASGYSVGDKIRIHYKTNNQWISDLGMDQLVATEIPYVDDVDWTAAEYQLYYEHVIAAINGTTITLEAPLVQAIQNKYGGADIFKYTYNGQISNVGVESLRLLSTYTSNTDEAHGWVGIKFYYTRDAWVRQVTVKYFGMSAVSINTGCHNFTVEDCAMVDPKSITTGGRKYSFNIDGSTYVLMQRCYTWGGRHDFVSGSLVSGPNTFVDCVAENTFSDSGPHHRYSTGQLYDNLKCGSLNVHNRLHSGTGHGWTGGQILFWNCDTTSFICDSPAGAMNWSIGTKGTHSQSWGKVEANGIIESNGTHVTPRSLYYRQLQARMGQSALRKVIVPAQDAGTLWTALGTWAGEGLFSGAVVAWTSASKIVPPTSSVNVSGRVRNLNMLERGVTTTWSKFSGPGTVTFGDPSLTDTTATFSTQGSYVLRLTANDGVTTATADVTVLYGEPGTLAFSATNYNKTEGNSGTSTVTVTVTRTGGSAGAASVAYATTNGSATSGSDYTTNSGTLNWTDGDAANKTFTVTIQGDTGVEPDETINLTLSNATGATLGSPSTATITITNDDVVPSYAVTYHANGASSGSVPMDGNSYTNGATVTVPGNTGSLAKTGYTFAGWNTAANGGGTSYSAGATFTISANTTLYAKWTANSYTLSFDGNGGNSPADMPVTYDSTYGTLPTPTRPGYTFKGWFTAATGGTEVTSSTTVATASDHMLYAQWINGQTVNASLRHYIRGESENVNATLGYITSTSDVVGTSGATGSRDDRNVVFGFVLPTLPVGATLESANFKFEITQARDSTGGANLPELHAYLLNTADPVGSGSSFYYHGNLDPSGNTKQIGTTSVSISVNTDVNYAAGEQTRSFTLTGDALNLLKSFYNGNTPTQSTAYIRFNMGADPAVTTFRRYRVNTAANGSSLQLNYVAPANNAPAWASGTITKASATEGVAYTGSLTTDASDVDNDALTFTKVDGPAWLNVAANGALSGLPGSSDIGTNSFTVSVSDGSAPAVQATLSISVLSTFDAWADSNGTGSETFNGDANGDGVADGIAWLLGAQAPADNARTLLPPPVHSQGNLGVSFKLLKPAVRGSSSLHLQFSRDLGVTDPWTNHSIPIPSESGTDPSGVVFSITPDPQDPDLHQIQATVPASAANGTGRIFVRLSAQAP